MTTTSAITPIPCMSSAAVRQPLYVLYGSNTGTSEAFAQRVANEAPSYGFYPSIGTLDSAVRKVPTDGPVIIITASFEGHPPDNAMRFVDWLCHLEGSTALANVSFAVFGCGNSDYTSSYQKIPTLCDERFVECGARRLVERGAGDAGKREFLQILHGFAVQLWAVLQKEYSTSHSESLPWTLEVKMVDAGKGSSTVLGQEDSHFGRVVENRVLTKDGPIKRHIEFQLPEGMTARIGAYVTILPQNPARDVRRVLTRFGLSEKDEVILSSAGPTTLPLRRPVKLSDILTRCVELSQPATTRDLGVLSQAASSEATRTFIEQLRANYSTDVQGKRLSAFEIVETHGDIDISIGAFLQMLPPMRVRQYSISSSPLWNPTHITLTISVGSNYLANLMPGDRVEMAMRQFAVTFHPPENPLTPVVMFCSGSGFAPMRGFIQERAAQKAAGSEVGTMLLFFGCRSPKSDFLYSDTDLAEWSKQGVVDVRPAFSRSIDDSKGCKYVQDRVWKDRYDVVEALNKGARFLACGSANVAKAIKSTLLEIIKLEDNVDVIEATARFERVMTVVSMASYYSP